MMHLKDFDEITVEKTKAKQLPKGCCHAAALIPDFIVFFLYNRNIYSYMKQLSGGEACGQAGGS